jgi:hypothetical protein
LGRCCGFVYFHRDELHVRNAGAEF